MASNAAEASSSDQDYTTSLCSTSSSTEDSQDELVEKARRALKERKRKLVNDDEVLAKLEELKDEMHKSSKRLRVPTFKYVSNKEQFNFNEEVMEELKRSVKKASSKVAKGITATIEKVRKRNKLIKMADSSKAGWRIVEEYLTDDIASDANDQRKIKKAEKAALKKMKEEKQKKKSASTSTSRKTYKEGGERPFRNASHSKRKGNTNCFRCGKRGHWGNECRKYRNEERAYEREERNRRYEN